MPDIWASKSLVPNPDLLFKFKTEHGTKHFIIIIINIIALSYKAANPDPAPRQTDANKRPLVLRPSMAPF
jgi:hypothetical protein